jgi:molecular chaperone DnaK (HSP70)
MHLLHHHATARALDGREMSLLELISSTLQFIAGQALAKLREQLGTIIQPCVRWVITVPALWNEDHKQFMRRAALHAGLVPQLNSPAVLLCLEPEGASIQCREDSESSLRQTLRLGSVVMVLDCGGGTVDITVHKLQCQPDEQFLCSELLPSSGGCEWGSRYVDIYY